MRENAIGPRLASQRLQVAVEHGQDRRTIAIGRAGIVTAMIPRHHAEARQAEHPQHLRHVSLIDQRAVGLEQEIVQQGGLTEIDQGAAHPFISLAGVGMWGRPYLPAPALLHVSRRAAMRVDALRTLPRVQPSLNAFAINCAWVCGARPPIGGSRSRLVGKA